MQFEFATAERIVFGRDRPAGRPCCARLRRAGAAGQRLSPGAGRRDGSARGRGRAPRLRLEVTGEHGRAGAAGSGAGAGKRRASGGCRGRRRHRCGQGDHGAGGAGNGDRYLEVIGAGRPLREPSRPAWIAVPTTAGTGGRGHAQRRHCLAAASRQGQFAQPVDAGAGGGGGPDLTFEAPARSHGEHGPGRADPVDRALRFAARQPRDGHVLPRGHAVCGARWSGRGASAAPGSPRRHGAGELAGRARPGQRRAGSGSRFRSAAGRHVRCACGAVLPRHAGQHPRPTAAGSRQQALARYREVAQILSGRAGAEAEEGARTGPRSWSGASKSRPCGLTASRRSTCRNCVEKAACAPRA